MTPDTKTEPLPCGRCGRLPTVISLAATGEGWQIVCANHPFDEKPQTEIHPTREAAVAEWNEESV